MYIIVTSVTKKLYIYIIDKGKMIATYTITYTLPVDICSVSFREIVIPNCLDIFFWGVGDYNDVKSPSDVQHSGGYLTKKLLSLRNPL
jgi:hypothetical protein